MIIMAYARYGDDSDVHVYFSVYKYYTCNFCELKGQTGANELKLIYPQADDDYHCKTPKEMITHLLHHHFTLGHKVPKYCMRRLYEEFALA